ncbi:hypothetical protein PC116_g12311 [Phytophthora cactorum]|uniref:Sulfatase N-terminal domain-containing protein n=2 Tax=Phytophthora cactorum TaxID=29920 RepID=A0A329SLT6_9STRA|nr:hypothetical protein PC111_g19273 [Phytophthora cactorum]KAG2979191.1 hypothetical protein PC119_g21558 [Phytophthora cactorum]KAG3087477.1 hypothetical protein PC122_g8808 [Phytophthora cactorum]KAG4239705.1 hypothetical protein PC116_g12311 [Phytophthora cactorum]RAW37837.1 hypothetical protein PC110_g5912 [Phytophthora cactorum]
MEKPDFSPLYTGKSHEAAIKRYLDLRYFTNMELGRFLDHMSAEGILNDTIVVIVGDHGQAPEADLWDIHESSVRRVASAIIAEGRLGTAEGPSWSQQGRVPGMGKPFTRAPRVNLG